MILVIPTDTEHTASLIPRYIPLDIINVTLYNEATQVESTPLNNYSITNGIMSVTFDFNFIKDDKYQLKIDDTNGIIYRGKLIATDQDPQEFKQTNDLYYYE